jgi:DNA-directed RNA polymerase specialized sigma24 family protein
MISSNLFLPTVRDYFLSVFLQFWRWPFMSRSHDLTSSWPAFLDELDTHPDQARQVLLEEGYKYLVASPPRAFSWFPPDRRLDLTIEVLLKLVENQFYHLKKYIDTGTAFVGWLRVVANNHAKDVKRRENREDSRTDGEDSLDQVPGPGPSRRKFDRKDVEKVWDTIRSLPNPLCVKILTFRLAHEFTNKEITRLLRWSADRNAEVGNHFRECRLKLIKALKTVGIDPSILED